MSMYKIDTVTRGGKAWFNRWVIQRMALFGIAGWFGMVLSSIWWLHPWQFSTWLSSGRFAYTFLWALPLGALGGFTAVFAQLKLQLRTEQQSAAQAIVAEQAKTPEEKAAERAAFLAARRAGFSGLDMGTATGTLLSRGHPGGLEDGMPVLLSPEDCAKNIIAFGGIGSGKTTRIINPLLLQVMEQDAGALIFDIKGDFYREFEAITAQAERSFKIVGDGGLTLNLLRGTTPELAASFLKSCFLAQGSGGDSQIWADSATEFCRNCLTLIKLADADYSLSGLYEIAVDAQARKALIEQTEAAFDSLSERDQRLLLATSRYFSAVWDGYDEKLKSSVMFSVHSVLSPFSHPDLVDAFSRAQTVEDGEAETGETGEADLTELIHNGAVFLVNIPQYKYGREGARFAYLLFKLRFFNMMRERRAKNDWNQTRHVAFVCDEYQSIVDPVSDTDFWDKSRSAKCVGIVSMQGVASLVQALNGNNKTAEAILQNFRQRVFFRTEDEATLRHVRDVLGQVDVVLSSEGENYSESVSKSAGPQGSTSRSTSWSESTNNSLQRQELFGPNDMRSLSADFCLFVGNLGGRAADEVLHVDALYVN